MRDLTLAAKLEEALLGTMLRAPRDYWKVEAPARPEDFGDAELAKAWGAAMRLLEANSPVSIETVCGELAATSSRETATRVASIARDVAYPDRGALATLSDQVREQARVRRIREALIKAVADADAGSGSAEVMAAVESGLLAIGSTEQDAAKGASDVLEEVYAEDDDPGTARIPTGLHQADVMLGGGFARRAVYVVAGRPGMGKSAWVGHIARHMSLNQSPVLIASLEMARTTWVRRYVSGRRDKRDEERANIGRCQMWVMDPGTLTVPALRAAVRRYVLTRGVRVVVVDYLQLMSSGEKHGNREQEVAAISRGLLAIAKDLDVCVIAVAQLNRGSERAADKRPMLADLRDSGQIEQDAHGVIMLYREEYYAGSGNVHIAGVTELHLRKNRAGAPTSPEAPILVRFDAKQMAFKTMERDEWLNYADALRPPEPPNGGRRSW